MFRPTIVQARLIGLGLIYIGYEPFILRLNCLLKIVLKNGLEKWENWIFERCPLTKEKFDLKWKIDTKNALLKFQKGQLPENTGQMGWYALWYILTFKKFDKSSVF